MTDFLSRLVDRALGQAPVLERRRPSLFDPQPQTGGLNSLIQGRSEEPVEESLLEPAKVPILPAAHSLDRRGPPASRARKPRGGHLESSVGPAEPGLEDIAHPHATGEMNQPRPASPLMPSKEFREEKAERVAAPVNPIERQPRRLEVIETIVEKKASISQAATRNAPRAETPDRTRPPIQTLSPPAQPAELSRTRKNRIHELEKNLEAIHDHKPRPLSSKPIEPVMKPAIPKAMPGPPAPAPITPEIRVTIGRLEIRAVTPAPTRAARARPAPPRLSLEAYLRSRSGGAKE